MLKKKKLKHTPDLSVMETHIIFHMLNVGLWLFWSYHSYSKSFVDRKKINLKHTAPSFPANMFGFVSPPD